jgi:hypothetical protein
MKTYIVRLVGNDTFDRKTAFTAESMEEAVKLLPHILEAQGQTTIEQFVQIEIRESKSKWLNK